MSTGREKTIFGRKREQGIIITLVAVFMLGIIGAMAALSIDVVTIYTARSETQLAADAAALAGARVLANSGATSDPTGTILASAEAAAGPAKSVALWVAQQNQIAGSYVKAGEVTVTFGGPVANPTSDPAVTVKIQKTDLPTFFARIWGTKQLTVAASATAEAYNPTVLAGTAPAPAPVAPTCVKPWLLPNLDPSSTGNPIFVSTTGALAATATGLLGWQTPPAPAGTPKLRADCGVGACSSANAPAVWRYYPGSTDPATGDFPAPPAASVTCTGCTGFSSFQLSIAGCEQKPVQCNQTVNIDTITATQDAETGAAVNGLIHSNSNGGDTVDPTVIASPPPQTLPFEFLPGSENPLVLSGAISSASDVVVSDSLVTVPVFDSSVWPPPTGFPTVQVIGFVQLFLSPAGRAVPVNGRPHTMVVNIVGCGAPATGGATGTPILGNGASPVAVRLISQ